MAFREDEFQQLPPTVQDQITRARDIGATCDTLVHKDKVFACLYGMQGATARDLYTELVTAGWFQYKPHATLVYNPFEQKQ